MREDVATPRFGRARTYTLPRIPAFGTLKIMNMVSVQSLMDGSRGWNSASAAVIMGTACQGLRNRATSRRERVASARRRRPAIEMYRMDGIKISTKTTTRDVWRD